MAATLRTIAPTQTRQTSTHNLGIRFGCPTECWDCYRPIETVFVLDSVLHGEDERCVPLCVTCHSERGFVLGDEHGMFCEIIDREDDTYREIW